MKNKTYKKYNFNKELGIGFILAVILNVIILGVSFLLSTKHIIVSSQINIYYTSLVGLLALYTTLLAITSNLSQEFPFKIALKFIIFSKLSFFYLLSLALNVVFVNIILFNFFLPNFSNFIFMLSYSAFFIITILVVILIFRKFNIEELLNFFFSDVMGTFYSGGKPKKIPLGFNIENKEDFFLITTNSSSDFMNKIVVNSDAEVLNQETNPSSEKTISESVKKDFLILSFSNGRLEIKNWDFLKKLPIKINYIKISKYEFGDSVLNAQIYCEFISCDENSKKNSESLFKENISYKSIDLFDYVEVFNKLKRNGIENKLIDLTTKNIVKESNLLERRFLFSNFNSFFLEEELKSKNHLDWDELLSIKVRNLYEQKHMFFDSPRIIAIIQNELLNILVKGFSKTSTLNSRLNNSGLNIKEFMDIRYMNQYEKTKNETWIREYEYLISNTIKNLFELCKYIMVSDLKSNIKYKYLFNQVGHLNTALEYYDTIAPTQFMKNYHSLKHKNNKSTDEIQSLELVKTKMKIIDDLKIIKLNKYIDIFYLILYYIDSEILNKDFFEISKRISDHPDFGKVFFEFEHKEGFDFLNYDWFEGGVQSLPQFNYNKYNLLMILHIYITKNELILSKFSKENFANYIRNSFEDEIENVSLESVNKYFLCDEPVLKSFKVKTLKTIKDLKKKFQKEKISYIAESPLEDKYSEKLSNDCKKLWNENQDILKNIFTYQELEDGEKEKIFFGQYTFFDKDWFLEPYDKNVSLSRDSGTSFGRSQVLSKRKKIIEDILNLFDTNKDLTIETEDLFEDLKSVIESNKEYYLFYNSTMTNLIYNLSNHGIVWSREDFEDAHININSSKVHLCHMNIEQSLLIEKKTFILKQYKKGYENYEDLLVVLIETIDKVAAKEILKSKIFKTVKEISQKVKIRIAEKFKIERAAGVIVKLNLKNEKPHKI